MVVRCHTKMDGDAGQNRLPRYRRIAFGTGHVLPVLGAAMWFAYNITFFTKVLLLPPKSAGNIILIGQLAGAVSTPFVGIWSDQSRCKYPGRRKIFHLVGVLAVALSFFFIWYECLGCQDAPPDYQVVYFASFAAVFQFGWAAVQVSQLSLIPELAPEKSIKVELNSIRFAFSILSFLLVFGTLWGILEQYNHDADYSNLNPSDKVIFWKTAVVIIGVGTPISMLFQFFIHENPNAVFSKLKWYKWLLNPKFYLVGCLYVSARIILLLPQAYLPLFLIDTLKMDPASIAKGPLILYIGSFITTLIVKRFNKTVGEKMTYFLGLAVVWSATIWFWVKDPTDDPTSPFNWSRDNIYGATFLMGAGGATVLVISQSMIAYLVGQYTGSGAFVYGWMNFADRLSNGVAVKIIAQVQPIPLTNPALPGFYRQVMICVPFAASGLGLITITVMVFREWWQEKHPENIQAKPVV